VSDEGITYKAAALRFGILAGTIRGWAQCGLIDVTHHGTRGSGNPTLIDPDSIVALLARRQASSASFDFPGMPATTRPPVWSRRITGSGEAS
jgi:hypothetical protein